MPRSAAARRAFAQRQAEAAKAAKQGKKKGNPASETPARGTSKGK